MNSNKRAPGKQVEDEADLAYGTIVMVEQVLQGRKLPSIVLQGKYALGLQYLDRAIAGKVGTTPLDATTRVDLFEAALASLRPVLANYVTTEKDWMEVIVRPELLRWRQTLHDAKAEERVERGEIDLERVDEGEDDADPMERKLALRLAIREHLQATNQIKNDTLRSLPAGQVERTLAAVSAINDLLEIAADVLMLTDGEIRDFGAEHPFHGARTTAEVIDVTAELLASGAGLLATGALPIVQVGGTWLRVKCLAGLYWSARANLSIDTTDHELGKMAVTADLLVQGAERLVTARTLLETERDPLQRASLEELLVRCAARAGTSIDELLGRNAGVDRLWTPYLHLAGRRDPDEVAAAAEPLIARVIWWLEQARQR